MLKRGGILPDSARIILLHGHHYLQQNNRAHRMRRRPTRATDETAENSSQVKANQVHVKVTSEGQPQPGGQNVQSLPNRSLSSMDEYYFY